MKQKLNTSFAVLLIMFCSYVGTLLYKLNKADELNKQIIALNDLISITKVISNYNGSPEDDNKIMQLIRQQKEALNIKVAAEVITDLEKLTQDFINGKQETTQRLEVETAIQKKINSLVKITANNLQPKYIHLIYSLKIITILYALVVLFIMLGVYFYIKLFIDHPVNNSKVTKEFWVDAKSLAIPQEEDNAETQLDLGHFLPQLLSEYSRIMLENDVQIDFKRITTDPILFTTNAQTIRKLINTALFALAKCYSKAITVRLGCKHSTIIIAVSGVELYLAENYHQTIFTNGASDIDSFAKLVERKDDTPKKVSNNIDANNLEIFDFYSAKELVNGKQGDMWVENDDEHGLTIWINIPT